MSEPNRHDPAARADTDAEADAAAVDAVAARQEARGDDTVAVPRAVSFDETLTVRKPSDMPAAPADAASPQRSAAQSLPPELASRMFKSPVDARYRVPEAPPGTASSPLPARGVTRAMPIVTATRADLHREHRGDATLEQRFGPVPESTDARPADRTGLRSMERVDRRFGAFALAGFGAAILISVLGLWGVALLALR